MNKFLLFIGMVFFPAFSMHGQEITFVSQELEAGVRHHLGLDAEAPITAGLLESITDIDLSSWEITDICDIAYMPNLKTLDLHDNEITNVTPLLVLESLQKVNLSNNQLTSIFSLSFSRSPRMEIDVAFNHIKDFSIFNTLTPCQFTIEGARLQTLKDAPYFLVRYLYSDGTKKSPSIYCRVDATTTEQAQMTVQDVTHNIATDNQPHVYPLGEGYQGTHQVMVTDGTYADSTYLVALKTVQVKPSKTVTIKTELPENYDLLFSPAKNGTLSRNGTDLTFKASSTFDYEEVIYTFYRSSELKGVAKVILTKNDVTDGIDTPTDGEAVMNIALSGDILSVRCPSGMLAESSVIEVCDVAGRVIVSQNADSSRGLNEQIRLPQRPHDIIIVRVTSGQKRFVDKLTTHQ